MRTPLQTDCRFEKNSSSESRGRVLENLPSHSEFMRLTEIRL